MFSASTEASAPAVLSLFKTSNDSVMIIFPAGEVDMCKTALAMLGSLALTAIHVVCCVSLAPTLPPLDPSTDYPALHYLEPQLSGMEF